MRWLSLAWVLVSVHLACLLAPLDHHSLSQDVCVGRNWLIVCDLSSCHSNYPVQVDYQEASWIYKSGLQVSMP